MFGLNGASFATPEAIYYLKNYIIIIVIGIVCSIPLLAIKKKINKNEKKDNISKNDGNIQIQQNTEDNKTKANCTKKQIAIYALTSIGYVAIVILSTSSLVNNSFNPFLYFRF